MWARSRSNGGAGQRDEGGDSEWRESALKSVLSCAVLR